MMNFAGIFKICELPIMSSLSGGCANAQPPRRENLENPRTENCASGGEGYVKLFEKVRTLINYS